MRVLILGAKGMLGHDLMKVFSGAIGWDRPELDITNQQEVLKKIKGLKPDLVINCAAYTDVDGAETNPGLAFKTNAYAVGYIAEACKQAGAEIVHLSTDYVFDGKKQSYSESDAKNPINIYGRSKAMGEDELIAHTSKYYLVRTAWLYGINGPNFVKKIIDLAKDKKEITVVDDQVGCPTYTKDLADGIKRIIGKPYGIYHLINNGHCSWFEFAREIARIKGLNVKVKPMKSSQLSRVAERPMFSVLLNTKADKLRYWKDALSEFITGELK